MDPLVVTGDEFSVQMVVREVSKSSSTLVRVFMRASGCSLVFVNSKFSIIDSFGVAVLMTLMGEVDAEESWDVCVCEVSD
mmetsp:Transcript_1312/g.2308  ORF Transcript_1312/g.2308 Transcript_1312/m.2308 type:complete len:80 (-) Transcript_1312:518-757(-)